MRFLPNVYCVVSQLHIIRNRAATFFSPKIRNQKSLYSRDYFFLFFSRLNDPSRRRRIKRDLASGPRKGVAGIRLEPDHHDDDHQDDGGHDGGDKDSDDGGGDHAGDDDVIDQLNRLALSSN